MVGGLCSSRSLGSASLWLKQNYTFCPDDLLFDAVTCPRQYRGSPSSDKVCGDVSLLYLVQRVFVGFVADAKVTFELPQRPHALPAVLLTDRQQQRGDRVVKLRNTHWIPGTQENDVCTTNSSTQTHTLSPRQFYRQVFHRTFPNMFRHKMTTEPLPDVSDTLKWTHHS